MKCANCGHQLAEDARFCPACGSPAVSHCSACGELLAAGARFCSACGTPADAMVQADAAAQPAARERKVASIVFADIVGYTSLTEESDPELVQAVVSQAFERLSDEVRRYEGAIEKFAGDALLALFGVPQAHEDDAERAVRAALEMQSAMAELSTELHRRGRPALELRIGIETGEVLVDLGRLDAERDRLVTGDPVNTAARLQAAAAPGTIVVGPGTYAATRELVEYDELAPLDLKGKALPVPAWRAVRVKARRGGLRAPLGLEAPLIGREEELGLLKETVRRLRAEGRPHLVTVVGSAGVGKSRLTWELEKYLDGLPEAFHWRKGRYFSYGQQSYGGLLEVIRHDAGILEDEEESAAERKLSRRLEDLGLSGDEHLRPALASLLGWASAGTPLSRDELWESLRRYLEAIARRAPLVLVMEDIHWADDGSLDFFDFVARWAEAPILLLGLSRHELLERRPGWGGGIANSATTMLEPLAPDENAVLLDALLPGSLPAGLKQRIVAVAEGNPLFSEELVRMLIDRGIARAGKDGWELVAPADELEIPGSIQALLAARLDTLPAAEKRLTQAAAVVGRIFWDAVLAHVVAGATPELDRLLRGLRAKELVVPREPSSLADAREYGFRHVLIRDVAYETVPKAERAEKHLQVARWAEERLQAREDELVELLAAHYHSALTYREEAWTGDEGELQELRQRVLEFSLRAARRATELAEAAAAAGWFRVAMEQAERLELEPLQQAQIALEYLGAGFTSEPFEHALVVARSAEARLLRSGVSRGQALDVLAGLQGYIGFLLYGTEGAEAARAKLDRSLAELPDDAPATARAPLLVRLGWLTWRAFSPSEAVPVLEHALGQAREAAAADLERQALHDLAIALEYSGRVGDGRALMEESMELARQAGDVGLLLRCFVNLPALMVNSTFDHRRAAELTMEGLARARRSGQLAMVAWLAGGATETLGELGRFAEAEELAVEARAAAAEIGDENLLQITLGYTGALLRRQGRLQEALPWAQQARAHGEEEPQSSANMSYWLALERWLDDRTGAVSQLSEALDGMELAHSEWRELARMALRCGQTAAMAPIYARQPQRTTPRAEADGRWAAAVLGEPGASSVAQLLDIAEQHRAAGLVLHAADALADAALIASMAKLPEAPELAERSRELYQSAGAEPSLDASLAAIGTLPESAAAVERP